MSQSRSEVVSSGVSGLDRILGGGLRAGRLYFVEGATGSGKTTLGLQFVLEGARRGEPVLAVSLAETADEVALVAASHGWSLDGLAVRDLSATGGSVRSTALFDLSEIELDSRVQTLIREMETLRPRRMLLDSLSALRGLNPPPAWTSRPRPPPDSCPCARSTRSSAPPASSPTCWPGRSSRRGPGWWSSTA